MFNHCSVLQFLFFCFPCPVVSAYNCVRGQRAYPFVVQKVVCSVCGSPERNFARTATVNRKNLDEKMAAMDTQTNNQIGSNGFGSSNGFGYDSKTLKNYAAMSAMYWPGFDSAGYAAAAYSQASALAAAASSGMGTAVNGGMNISNIQNAVSSPNTQQTSIISSSLGNSMPNAGSLTANIPMQTSLISSNSSSPSNSIGGGSSLHSITFPAHSTTACSPKKKAQPVPEEAKDDHYWERRKRNNESARRSRESRRMKEEQIALRVVYLEQENLQLRTEVSMLRAEIEKMRMLLYNTATHH